MNIISQKKLYSPLIAATICLTFLFAACQAEGDCTQDTRTSVGTAFFQPVLGANQQYATQTLTDTIRIKGVGSDSLINDTLSISAARLPLKSFEKNTSFVIQKDNLKADTITFIHDNTEQLLSLECGVKVIHDIKDIRFTRNRIDSIKIAISRIADNKTANQVKIYFKVE